MHIRTIGHTQPWATPAENQLSQPVQGGSSQTLPVQTVHAVSDVGTSQQQQPETTVSAEEKKTVDSVLATLQTVSSGLQFQIDEDSGKVVVKMVDKQSGEVLKQIPSEEALKIAFSLSKLTGILLNEKA